MTSTIQSLSISIPETLLHVTLKRRAEISADIFARLLRYFFLSCKNLTIKDITDDPNEMWKIWKTWFLDVLNGHAPISDITIKGNNLPYITMELRQMIRQRDYLRKKANKTGSNILLQAFQPIRNKVTYIIRKLRAKYYSKTLKKNEGDLKKTWKILKQVMCKDTKTTKIDHIEY